MHSRAPSRITTITHRSDFLIASAKGKRFVVSTFILQMVKRNDAHPAGHPARLGFTVTKKMGTATTRNRIKRRLREASRMAGLPHALPQHDYVIISRQKALACPFSDLLRDMEFAFSRIPYMKDSQPSKPKADESSKRPHH